MLSPARTHPLIPLALIGALALCAIAVSLRAQTPDTAAVAPLSAGSTLGSLTVGQITYNQVRIRTLSAQTAMIQHEGGIASLRLRDLTPELQQRFGYNPDAAAAESEKQKAASAAAEKLRQEQLAAQKKVHAARLAARRFTTTDTPSRDAKIDQLLRSFGQAPEIKTQVDLRPRFNELGLWIKNQGVRPSCAVFAVVSALEFQSAERTGNPQRFSEEYLLWATYKILNKVPRSLPKTYTSINQIPEDMEVPDEGFTLSEVVTALRSYGIPLREHMPNQILVIDELKKPSDEIIENARQANLISVHTLPGRDPAMLTANVIHALNAGIPVAIGLAWPDAVPRHSGYIDKQGTAKNYGHAVTLVGYKADRGMQENAVFTFKNSYGTRWGVDGYGFVTYRYLSEHLHSAVVIEVQSP